MAASHVSENALYSTDTQESVYIHNLICYSFSSYQLDLMTERNIFIIQLY